MTFKISVPLHITGFFSPHFSGDPLFCGSTGAGLVITPGLSCICKFSNKKRNEVLYNGVTTKIKPIEKLLKLVNFNKKVLIQISSPVPLGLGYGVSGASTLAVSLALHGFLGEGGSRASASLPPESDLNPVVKFGQPRRSRGNTPKEQSKFYYGVKAAKLAHIAEVKSLTGLGDVIAIFSGKDLAVRIKPGAPGTGIVESFKQAKNFRIITADLKKGSTKKMLKSISPEVLRLGQNLLKKFIKNPDLKNFFRYSQLFAKKMEFGDENFFGKLEPLKKYSLGFTVKKGVLFSVVEKKYLNETLSQLRKISKATHVFQFGGGIEYEK